MWIWYNQAYKWKVMPSELLFIKDPVAAYSLNNAVWRFGSALEAALMAVSDKDPKREEAKRLQVMEQWLPGAPDAPAPKKPASAFADPAAMMHKA